MATDRSKKALQRSKDAQNFVMLAHKYNPKKHLIEGKKSILDWQIFPKLDGIRARLHKGKLLSRTKRPLAAPKEFEEMLCDLIGDKEWDGELMHPSKTFQESISIIRDFKNSSMEAWKGIVYNVFDIVDLDLPFEDRYLKVSSIKAFANAKPVLSHKSVKTNLCVSAALNLLEYHGYEGAILRNPESKYELGRSHNLLKVKSFQDIEVTVKSIEPGEGQLSGMMGALICELDNGKEVKVGGGFTHEERRNPPAIGDKITVIFFEYTDDGIPRFPNYKSIRTEEV